MEAVKILNGVAYQIIFKPISFQIMAKFFNGMQFVMQLFCQEHYVPNKHHVFGISC